LPFPQSRPDKIHSEDFIKNISVRFVGVELYFDDVERARAFYIETLGLQVSDEQPGHHAKFGGDAGFVCLERKGVENYPSSDKAVLFFEVPDLGAAITIVGKNRVVQRESEWAVFHDPEAHNVMLLQGGS